MKESLPEKSPATLEQLSPEKNSIEETSSIESRFDVLPLTPEQEPETTEERARQIVQSLHLKESLHTTSAPETTKIAALQEKHIPPYLKKALIHGSLLNKALDILIGNLIETKGAEYLPEQGPFLVVSNHFGSDSQYLLALLKDYDTHVTASEAIHWHHSPLFTWFLKQMRALPVPESLAHLSDEQKQQLLSRIDDPVRKSSYEQIIAREAADDKNQLSERMRFIRSTVALLTRGDVVILYPEGLWLYEGGAAHPRAQTMYQGYPGMEVIARQYQALTGQELPIVPVAQYTQNTVRKMTIQKPLFLSQNTSGLSDTDWCLAHIANKLPAEQRGYYAQIRKENALETESI